MHIIVPVKCFSLAKRRLAPALTAAQRAALARAMLQDVLEALAGVEGVGEIALVSDEPALPQLDMSLPVVCHPPEAGGLNAALEGRLSALGAAPALVLHADLPLLQTAEVQALVDQARPPFGPAGQPIVAVPDRHGSGTNALLLPRADAMAPGFGRDSLARHAAAARRAGWPFEARILPSLALDIDEPADLARLLQLGATMGTPRRSISLVRQWTADRADSATRSRGGPTPALRAEECLGHPARFGIDRARPADSR